MPVTPPSASHSDRLRQEFATTVDSFLILLATAVIWASSLKDVTQVGLRWDWMALRFGYLPYMLLVRRLSRRLPAKYYETPLWASTLYITAFVAFFASTTGNFGSSYFNGLVQLYTATGVMPLTAFGFFGAMLSSLLGFTSICFALNGWQAWPERAIISNLLPLLVCPPIVFVIASRLRRNAFRWQSALERLVHERDAMIDSQARKLARAETQAALGHVAAEVAHDIRSPLSALKMLREMGTESWQANSSLLVSAIRRIEDIANSLLRQYQNGPTSTVSEEPGPVLLVGALRRTLAEKRLERRSEAIVFDEYIAADATSLFVEVDPVELGRVLSNLLNNSVEAMDKPQGRIELSLTCEGDEAVLTLDDNGAGMTPETLERVWRDGISHGKKGGFGIGLKHARRALEKWGGELTISSRAGAGTSVQLRLPVARPPEWFVGDLERLRGKHVLVLDDDPSIHDFWRVCAEQAHLRRLSTFGDPDIFAQKLSEVRGTGEAYLCLIDYQLALSPGLNGLEVIDREKLPAERALLVTSAFDQAAVVAGCAARGIPILPKSLLSSMV